MICKSCTENSTFWFWGRIPNFGEPASVQCTILGGDLPISITWLLNNNSIENLYDISKSKIGQRINVLSIESVTGDHSGTYTWLAKNIAGNT